MARANIEVDLTLGLPPVPSDFVVCLSDATDLVSVRVGCHNHRVGYVAHQIASAMGLDGDLRRHILAAGARHDIGALSLAEVLTCFEAWRRGAFDQADYSIRGLLI